MSAQTSERVPRMAPGQMGGPEWKGPRQQVLTRLDLTTAALVKTRARQAGVSVSEFVADLIRQGLR
ncbi:MAG: hypothetical protein VX494_10085 [Actinomycetota bacterium]|nr:hypothetical protein [Actinomycetota bacterium]